MIDRSFVGVLAVMRERKAGDVFRYVRFGELNKAQLALGAVDSIDEILRYFDLAEEAETRAASLGESPSGRKLPQRVPVLRSHEYSKTKNKESKNA